MKKLRLFLIVLAAPAAVLLGMHEFGGTPISKGYDTGFEWRAESNSRVVLSADPEGNMTCWLRLKIPATKSEIAAATSGNVRLRVTPQNTNGGFQWLSVTKDSIVAEDKFDWPSGGKVNIDFGDKAGKKHTSLCWGYISLREIANQFHHWRHGG